MGWGCGKTLGGGRGISLNVRFEVRDGFKIRFCYDARCGDHTLKEAFLCCLVLLSVRRPQW